MPFRRPLDKLLGLPLPFFSSSSAGSAGRGYVLAGSLVWFSICSSSFAVSMISIVSQSSDQKGDGSVLSGNVFLILLFPR